MKILISHSYFMNLDPKEAAGHRPYPPLAPLTMAAWIKEKLELDVCFYDVMFDRDEQGLVRALEDIRPDVFILYDDDFNFLTKMCLKNMRAAIFRMLQKIRKKGLFIAHGSDASDQAEAYLQAGFDLVLHRNAEKVLLEVLEEYRKTGSLTQIHNMESLSFKQGDTVVHTPPAKKNLPLEQSPMPRWDFIDLSPYRKTWIRHHGRFSLNISTSHGCPYGCNWCAKPLYGRSYQVLAAEQVARQFQFMKEKLGAHHIWITDDIFSLKPGWISEFANHLEKLQTKLPYKCLSRADLITAPFAGELKRSGCEEVWLGVESGSQKVLDAMEKGIEVPQIYQAANLLKEAGIQVGFFLQFGYPGEEMSDIRKTLNLIKDCLPDYIGISVSYPLKGTKFYDQVASQMGEKKNWQDSGDLELMYPGRYPPDFYRALHQFTHHYFGWLSLRKPQPLKKKLRRIAAQYRHIPGMISNRLKMRSLETVSQKHVAI